MSNEQAVVLKAKQLGAKSTFGSGLLAAAVTFPHQFCTQYSLVLKTFTASHKGLVNSADLVFFFEKFQKSN